MWADIDECSFYTALEYYKMKSELLSKNNQLQRRVEELEKSVLRIASANAKLIETNNNLERDLLVARSASGAYTLEKENEKLVDRLNRIYDILEES